MKSTIEAPFVLCSTCDDLAARRRSQGKREGFQGRRHISLHALGGQSFLLLFLWLL
jgi:hypothetical protein